MWHTHISQEAFVVKKKRKRKDTRSVKDTHFYMVVQCLNIYALCVNILLIYVSAVPHLCTSLRTVHAYRPCVCGAVASDVVLLPGTGACARTYAHTHAPTLHTG